MIIDAHNHIGMRKSTLDEHLRNMAECDIDQTWLLSAKFPAIEAGAERHDAATGVQYALTAPGKFILAYAPDPRRPEAVDWLAQAMASHGVRVYGELKIAGLRYDIPEALEVYRFCGEHQLPVTMHVDYEVSGHAWYGGGIEALENMVQACPGTTFIGHAPGFWAHISADGQHLTSSYPTGKIVPGGKVVTMLRAYPNLCADLSANSGLNALRRDPAFTMDFLLEFQDRLLYGRDSLSNDLNEFLSTLNLPEEVLAKIHAGNATRLIAQQTNKATH